jgi:hypothetical protein
VLVAHGLAQEVVVHLLLEELVVRPSHDGSAEALGSHGRRVLEELQLNLQLLDLSGQLVLLLLHKPPPVNLVFRPPP